MNNKTNWENITREELLSDFCTKGWFDSDIAEIYGVSKGAVAYKRAKLDISETDKRVYLVMHMNLAIQNESLAETNAIYKRELCSPASVNKLAKAITHLVFRNGPVEDMHADGKLSQDDMMTLNKYMVNMLAGLLQNAIEGNWLALGTVIESQGFFGTDWDEPVPDNTLMEDLLQLALGQKGHPVRLSAS